MAAHHPDDLAVAATTSPSRRRRAVIIDTDTGIDDAQALIVLLQRPDLHILAVTVTHGNVAVGYVEGNVCACAAVVGRTDVPVFLGAPTPLVCRVDDDASYWHGTDGLGNTGYGATAPRTAVRRDRDATYALADMAIEHCESTGDTVDIITLGPLTNLALAVRLHPRMIGSIGRVFVMGGAYTARGNTNMAAEYNIKQDPEAASIVFSTFPRIVMVTWELTLAYPLPPEFVHGQYLTTTTPIGRWLAAVSQHLITMTGPKFDTHGLYIPDPLCACIAADPTIITKSMHRRVVVECAGTYTRGMTVVDWTKEEGEDANVQIVEGIDLPAVKAMLLASVGAAPRPPAAVT